jgi:hypothetical protein
MLQQAILSLWLCFDAYIRLDERSPLPLLFFCMLPSNRDRRQKVTKEKGSTKKTSLPALAAPLTHAREVHTFRA